MAIKEGKFKSEITEIRNSLKENNKNKLDGLKNSLSGFTVSAIFDEKRRKERVIKYYGVMVLDIIRFGKDNAHSICRKCSKR